MVQPRVLQLRRLMIGASPCLPEVARTYYERAPEQTRQALAGCFGQLAARGLLRFTAAELRAQADAGVAVFLAAYGEGHDGAVPG